MNNNQRANEDQFNELHRLVTQELASRIKQGADCSTQDIKAAIDWLSKNNITGVPVSGSPLAALLEAIEIDLEDVERVIQ
jgi:hypothetical protein